MIQFFGQNIKELQGAVHCFARHCHFGRAKKEVMKLQAAYRREYLVFIIHEDKEMLETLMKVFKAQKQHQTEPHKNVKEYK